MDDDERNIYKTFILPSRGGIKDALLARLSSQISQIEIWKSYLAECPESIIGSIASEVIDEVASFVPSENLKLQSMENVEHISYPETQAPATYANTSGVTPRKLRKEMKMIIAALSLAMGLAIIVAVVFIAALDGKEDAPATSAKSVNTSTATWKKTKTITAPYNTMGTNRVQIKSEKWRLKWQVTEYSPSHSVFYYTVCELSSYGKIKVANSPIIYPAEHGFSGTINMEIGAGDYDIIVGTEGCTVSITIEEYTSL